MCCSPAPAGLSPTSSSTNRDATAHTLPHTCWLQAPHDHGENWHLHPIPSPLVSLPAPIPSWSDHPHLPSLAAHPGAGHGFWFQLPDSHVHHFLKELMLIITWLISIFSLWNLCNSGHYMVFSLCGEASVLGRQNHVLNNAQTRCQVFSS